MPKKLLEGIRVADFTWAAAGPLTTKPLSDYGAEVIKIEGTGARQPPSRSAEFSQGNTGKLSLTLNLAHPKGVEVAKRLVARADIVVENFAGGTMKRLGLGYEELKKVNSNPRSCMTL